MNFETDFFEQAAVGFDMSYDQLLVLLLILLILLILLMLLEESLLIALIVWIFAI